MTCSANKTQLKAAEKKRKQKKSTLKKDTLVSTCNQRAWLKQGMVSISRSVSNRPALPFSCCLGSLNPLPTIQRHRSAKIKTQFTDVVV
jgi:hypothetical protein